MLLQRQFASKSFICFAIDYSRLVTINHTYMLNEYLDFIVKQYIYIVRNKYNLW